MLRSCIICLKLSLLLQHCDNNLNVSTFKFNFSASRKLLKNPQIFTNLNFEFTSVANEQNPKRVYPLYLWPRSKGWMRARGASVQPAATKVTNIGDRLSLEASISLDKIKISGYNTLV